MTLPSGMTDTNNNASDFVLVELNGATLNGNTTTQGAPGPSGLLSPTGVTASAIATALLDPAAATTAAPNQARLNPNPNVSTSIAELGTLALRRTYTNNTTQPIRKLCFRVIDITNSATGTLARVNVLDANGGVMATSAGNKTVYGTRLLAPSVTQGGLNAALGVNEITLASPLPPGQAVNVEFLLGVRRGGTYRFVVRFEVQTQ